jgi:hypothetical protein
LAAVAKVWEAALKALPEGRAVGHSQSMVLVLVVMVCVILCVRDCLIV